MEQLLKRQYCFCLAAGFDTGPPKPPPKTFVRYRPFSMTAASVPKLHYCNDCVTSGWAQEVRSTDQPDNSAPAERQLLELLEASSHGQSKVGFPFICQSRNVEKDCESNFVDSFNAQAVCPKCAGVSKVCCNEFLQDSAWALP